jgi:hypothetical protein
MSLNYRYPLPGTTMNPYRPTILSPEGSAEVEEELKNGSPMTPERKAMFERIRAREAVRARLAAEAEAAK